MDENTIKLPGGYRLVYDTSGVGHAFGWTLREPSGAPCVAWCRYDARAFAAAMAASPAVPEGKPVTLTYTNWRGETAERTITPTGRILFTSNEWHPEPQWLVEAHDERSGEVRLFALTGFGKSPAEAGGDEIAAVERLVDAFRDSVCNDIIAEIETMSPKTGAARDAIIAKFTRLVSANSSARDVALEQVDTIVAREREGNLLAMGNAPSAKQREIFEARTQVAERLQIHIRALKTQVQPIPETATAGSDDVDRAISLRQAIDLLTDGEGDTVTFCSPNADFNGLPDHCVMVNAFWTDWRDRDFRADTEAECLAAAIAAMKEASHYPPKTEPRQDGDQAETEGGEA